MDATSEARSFINSLVLTDWEQTDLTEKDVENSIQKIEELICRNPQLLESSPRFAENSKAVISKLKRIANEPARRKLDELSKFINTRVLRIDSSITFDNVQSLLGTACFEKKQDGIKKCFDFLKSKSSSSNPRQKPTKWLREQIIRRYLDNQAMIKHLLIGSCLINEHACRDVCLRVIQEHFLQNILKELNNSSLCISEYDGQKNCSYKQVSKELLSSFSRYFERLFYSGMRESTHTLISILEPFPAELSLMLDSILTDELPITPDNYQVLLQLSDKYEFPQIKERVEKWVIHNLDFSSRDLVHYKLALEISDDFQANRLKGTVIAEVAKNLLIHGDHLRPLSAPICQMLQTYGSYVTNLDLMSLFDRIDAENPFFPIGLMGVFQFMGNVTSLNLSYNRTLNDSACKTLVTCLRNVAHIDLSWCTSITLESIKLLSTQATSLQSLDVSFCTNMQDPWIDCIAQSLTNLRSLNLNRCNQLTDRSMMPAARCLTNLQSLSLEGCKNISDRSLISWSKNALALRELNLVNCRITNLGLQSLGRFSTKLRSLTLTISSKVTPDEVVLMASSLTKLRSLRLRCPPQSLETPNMGNMKRLAQVNSVIELIHTPGSPQRTDSNRK